MRIYHLQLIENGEADVVDGISMLPVSSSDLVAKEREISDLHQQVLCLKEQLEKVCGQPQ